MAPGAKPSTSSTGIWTSAQAYALAMICLAVGLVLGYLFRGSASPAPAASSPEQQTAGTPPAGMSSPGPATIPGSTPSQPAMSAQQVQQAAQPMLETLKQNPNDVETLTKLGNLYYDAQQFDKAVEYYGKVLGANPRNVNVRTDMGTAYWYMNNPDRAISEFEKSLSYEPTHPQTLFNLGMVKWQGKKDAKGAVEAWEKLLKMNPAYPEKDRVQTLISQAKEHGNR